MISTDHFLTVKDVFYQRLHQTADLFNIIRHLSLIHISFPWKSLSPRQTHTPSLLAKQSLCAVQRGRSFDFAVFIAFSVLSLKIERLTPL